VACPDGKEKVFVFIEKSVISRLGLVLSTESFVIDTIGISNTITNPEINAVFFPFFPPKINNIISTIGQKISLP
jgi:hypothetical protein